MSPRGLMSPPLFYDVRPLNVSGTSDSPPASSSLTAARKPARFMPLSTHPSRTPAEDVARMSPPLESPLSKPSFLPTTTRLVNGDKSPPFHRLTAGMCTSQINTNF